MIDPGRPFSQAHPYLDLIRSMEEQIREGVQQVDQKRFVYKSSESAYELPRVALAITAVNGILKGNATSFTAGIDFDLSNNRLIWRSQAPATHPDEGTRFEVIYTYRDRPAGLNDFTPGSVVGTLVRAISLELKLLYEQMDEAYRRGFIDTASGPALDNVVALLGITRNLAVNAIGSVTFTRTKANRAATIRKNTKVATENGLIFVTTEEAVMDVGILAIDVGITAEKPGPEGNVDTGKITLMPTPPPGVGSVQVSNAKPLEKGQDEESDTQLRERAKFRLERSGNATLNAIKFAILEKVEGVTGVEVLDTSVDPTIPLGEVRVRYSGDANRGDVEAVVQATRAAGVLAQVSPITQILIAGRLYVIPDGDRSTSAIGTFRDQAIAALRALSIGESLSIRRLNSLVYGVTGLADVAESQLTHNRGGTPNQPVSDPFLAQPTEQLQPDDANLQVISLYGFRITVSRAATASNLAIQLGILSGQPPNFGAVQFQALTIAVTITFKAKLLSKPDDVPETVATFNKTLQFISANTANLVINDVDVRAAPDRPLGFRTGTHNPNGIEIMLQAATYPGLQFATASVNFPP